MQKHLFILLFAFVACDSPEPPYALPDNAIALISNSSEKTWKLAQRFNKETRMNMGDCFLSYRQTFNSDMTLTDNNGEIPACGESLNATWEFAKDKKGNYYIKVSSKQIPHLMGTDKDFKLFKIKHLSSQILTVEYSHAQFSDIPTKITDVYIPENATISNRNFHW